MPENLNEEVIPKILREAFDALRSPDEPGHTFAMTVAEINGKYTWVIAGIVYDPETNDMKAIIPIFQCLPTNAKVVVEGIEAEDITALIEEMRKFHEQKPN